MTAKEQREVNRLKIKIEELEARQKKEMAIYGDNISEIVTLRIALRNAHDALVDAVVALQVIYDEPVSERLEVRK